MRSEKQLGLHPKFSPVSVPSKAVGSGVERFLDTEEVNGSNPLPPIQNPRFCDFQSHFHRFLRCLTASIHPNGGPKVRLSALPFTKTESVLSLAEIERNAEGWLLDGEIRQHSDTTLANRRLILDKLLWFLRERSYPTCGLLELRQFLAYISRGNDQGGRWGNARVTSAALPSTVQTYHRHLRTFFRWLISEGILEASPMESITTPVARPDQVQPFTQAQVQALLQYAKKSQFPRRNEAILLFLLDRVRFRIRASQLGMAQLGFKSRGFVDKRAARKVRIASALSCRQCIPTSFIRWVTTCLQLASTTPLPM
jgi:hypothetical protein